MPGLSARDLAEKAETHTTFADLETNGGALNEYQLAALKEIVQAESRLLGQSKVDYVGQKKGKYDWAGIPQEILYPVDEHGEVPEAYYTALSTTKVPFECNDYAGAVPISDTSDRNSLARGTLGSFTMRQAGPALAMDIAKKGLLSDETSLDPRLAKFDGLILQAVSHVLDPGTAADIESTLWYYMRLAMPSKYWKDLKNMRYYCSPNTEAAYIYWLESKTAAPGYQFTLEDNGFRATYHGVPIFPLEEMPDGTAILTHKDNIIFVMEENVTWEVEREPKKRRFLYHVHCSFDAVYGYEDAVVIHKNVAVPVAPTT